MNLEVKNVNESSNALKELNLKQGNLIHFHTNQDLFSVKQELEEVKKLVSMFADSLDANNSQLHHQLTILLEKLLMRLLENKLQSLDLLSHGNHQDTNVLLDILKDSSDGNDKKHSITSEQSLELYQSVNIMESPEKDCKPFLIESQLLSEIELTWKESEKIISLSTESIPSSSPLFPDISTQIQYLNGLLRGPNTYKTKFLLLSLNFLEAVELVIHLVSTDNMEHDQDLRYPRNTEDEFNEAFLYFIETVGEFMNECNMIVT